MHCDGDNGAGLLVASTTTPTSPVSCVKFCGPVTEALLDRVTSTVNHHVHREAFRNLIVEGRGWG